MICSLLIENASKATSQGSDKKKNCELKKRKRKQRSTFSFRKKVMLMTVTTTTTLHSRFTIFLKRNFGEIFAPWLFQEFIYWHCLHSLRTFFGGGLEKVKETSICFEKKSESKCVFTFYQCSTFDAFLADSHETRKIVTAWDVLSKDICSRVWPTLDRLMFLK